MALVLVWLQESRCEMTSCLRNSQAFHKRVSSVIRLPVMGPRETMRKLCRLLLALSAAPVAILLILSSRGWQTPALAQIPPVFVSIGSTSGAVSEQVTVGSSADITQV